MGDKVWRVTYEYEGGRLDLYPTEEEARKVCQTEIGSTGNYFNHRVVSYELPEGVHLGLSDDKPSWRIYYPNCVDGYPDERYHFDDMDALKRWTISRWPNIPRWEICPYHRGNLTLEGVDEKGRWVAAFVRNVKPCAFSAEEIKDV